jgi:hypothetical protein
MKSPLHSQLFRIPVYLLLGFTAAQAASFELPQRAEDVEAPKPAAAPAKAGPEMTSELGKEIVKAKFNRSGEALLEATKARRKDTPVTAIEAFQMSVMLGDWTAVAKTLAELPPEDAVTGYTVLLDSLAEQSVSVGTVLKAPENNQDEDPNEQQQRLQNEREEMKKQPAPILSEDFYSLVNACPGNLREENIPALTKLATTALGESGRTTLVERMKTEWKGFGSATPEGRKLAALLLSSLGWIRDATPFLPLKSEEWAEAETTQLVFAMEYFTQTGIAEHDERQLLKAADISALLMKTARFGSYTRPQFRLAMDRLVQLLPVLEPALAQKLIREQLFTQTATLSDLIGILGELGQTAAAGTDLPARSASLGTQRLILEALVENKDPLPPNVAVLVMNWLNEAEACYRSGGVVATEVSQADRLMMRRYGIGDEEKPPILATAEILATAPPQALISRLNPGLAQRVLLTLVKVSILKPDDVDLTLLRDYVKTYPGLEREVCQDVISGWSSKRTKPAESPQVKQMRAWGMPIPASILQQGSGIPLTRLRQNQNIQQFKSLLTELRKISPQPLDPALIVQAFMTLHSGAEVYRLEDIIAIFGPPEKMVRKELLELLGGMRARLGEEWRDNKTQQQSGTNRTEEEAKDEVSRGYCTAMELAKRGILAADADWESFITRGQLFYDASQYELKRQVKLTEYVNLRDEAFASFKQATEIYAAKAPSLPKGQWTIEPYKSWFFVMLGASDLAQLTSNTARTDPGLKSIGDALRALPGDAATKHVELFAKMLGEVFPRVPANVRQVFLGSGLGIIGADHPAATSVTKSLDYYKELLNEIQLRIKIDGPSQVGHSQVFGTFVSLETSRQLLRESGGFSKYLQNKSAQLRQGGGDEKDLREDFTKNLHAALDETFEVVFITFHDAAVKTIDLPREGWIETPLAYMVLRAKNPAVDRIPSFQIDMDFMDLPGQVVLPVMSQVEPLDAKDKTVSNRPCNELKLNLTMDEREWKDGKIVVDIQATGQGVIPNLDNLLDCPRDGFTLETTDSNLAVSQFVSDGKQRLPQTDRTWQLTYTRKPDLKGDVQFAFPQLKSGVVATAIEYKHYQDADLVALTAAQAANGIKLISPFGNGLRNTLLVCLLLAAIAGIVVFLRRKKTTLSQDSDSLAIPAVLTPFTTVAYLRRLRASSALSNSEQAALTQQIQEIEATCFRREPTTTLDLSPLIQKWQEIARASGQ